MCPAPFPQVEFPSLQGAAAGERCPLLLGAAGGPQSLPRCGAGATSCAAVTSVSKDLLWLERGLGDGVVPGGPEIFSVYDEPAG